MAALDKVSGNYQGTTFPGGHVERNETFTESVIREVSEETGLVIEDPKLCGFSKKRTGTGDGCCSRTDS